MIEYLKTPPNRAMLKQLIARMGGGVLGTLLAHVMFDLSVFQVSATVRTGPAQWVCQSWSPPSRWC